MSDLSLTLFCFSCVSFSIVPCCYGQVSGVKVWLAKRYQGIKILKETERKKKIGYGILITVNSQKPFISPTERNRPLLDNGLHYRLGFIPNFPCFISAFYHI